MEDNKMYRLLLLCVLLFPLSSNARPADTSCTCQAPAQIREEIKRANRNTIKSLLTQYPEDFWVQRAYIDLMTISPIQISQSSGIPSGKVEEPVIAQFGINYESQPDNPQAAYLYAYALIHTDTRKTVEILTEMIQTTPAFPAAWMTLGILYGYPDYFDQEKQRTYIETFLARCPDTVEPRVASLAMQLDRSDILVAYIKNLRERIAGKEDEDLIPLYYYLWQMESKSALPEESAELKDRIKGDLKFLEGLDFNTYRSVPPLLMRGYEQIGDKAAMDKLSARQPQLSSTDGLSLFFRARADWTRANPAPPPNADPGEQTVYYKKQLQFLDLWENRIPDNITLLEPSFIALSAIPGTSNEVLIHKGDRILEITRRTRSGTYVPAAMKVLQIWADRDILLDHIPSILDEFMALQPQTSPFLNSPQQSDLIGGSYQTLSAENQRWTADTSSWQILLTIHIKKGRIDQACNILDQWGKGLENRRKKADEIKARQLEKIRNSVASATAGQSRNIIDALESTVVRGIPSDESKYYRACAQLASTEGRSLDALTFYQSSLRLLYEGAATQPFPMDIEVEKSEANILWKKLGGSQTGWEIWLKSIQPATRQIIPSVPRQVMTTRTIPDFSLSDQHGETWTLTGIKGKTTLINVWATWCGPCRQELPHIQKLYEKTKNRSDIQILTLNIDQDRTLVEPFLKENNFSFPSLYARSFVEKFAGPIGIPTTWISDTAGKISFETLGFGGNGPQWLDQILNQLETVSGSAK